MTQNIPHPSFFIDTQFTDTISRFGREAEKSGKLVHEQLSVIYQQKWFNLFVPVKFGGLGLSLPEGLKIEECLAWADGSTGWTVTLCSGANWFIGFLDPEIAQIIFNNNKVCLAGSGRPSGVARMIDDEFEISGYWQYATGAPHATAFTANCVIEKDGAVIQNEDGSSFVYSFIFLREEVAIHEDWNCIGMVATASHSFEVKDLRVKKNRCFRIDANYSALNDAIYQYPFLHFAEATLAVNYSGMAFHYFDLFEALVKARESNKNYTAQMIRSQKNRLEGAKKKLQNIRRLFYKTVDASLDNISTDQLKEVSKTSKELAATAIKLVDELYPYSGLGAADPDSQLSLVWRDLHTASQHPLLLSW